MALCQHCDWSRRHGMQRFRQSGAKVCRVVLVAGMLATMVSPAGAQTASSPRPVGKVAIDQAQVAFIGSASVGGGTLFFHGHSYRFTINGLGVGGFGAAKI